MTVLPLMSFPVAASAVAVLIAMMVLFLRDKNRMMHKCYLYRTSVVSSHGYTKAYSSSTGGSSENKKNRHSNGQGRVWHIDFRADGSSSVFGRDLREFNSISDKLDFLIHCLRTTGVILAAKITYCTSKNDYPHFHMVVRFKGPRDRMSVKNLLGNNPHVDLVARSSNIPDFKNIEMAIKYIEKRGKRFRELGEAVVDFREFGRLQGTQGVKTDLYAVIEDAKRGDLDPESLWEEYPSDSGYQRKAIIQDEFLKSLYERMGRPEQRDVFVTLVTGATGTGKLPSIVKSAKANGLRFFKLSEISNLERYGGEEVIILDEPCGDTCSKLQFSKLLDSSVSWLKVRYHHVITLWQEVMIRTDLSPEELGEIFFPGKPEKLLSRLSSIRFCFRVTNTEDLSDSDGYEEKLIHGYPVHIRKDYIDVPSGEYEYHGMDDIRRLALIYFNVTAHPGDVADGFDGIELTERDAYLRDSIMCYADDFGEIITPETFVHIYCMLNRETP